MIKEIQEIAKEMLILNNQVHGAILSSDDLQSLTNNLITIQQAQTSINYLLDKSSLISATDTMLLIEVLSDINQLISQLAYTVEQIQELSSKFVCKYQEEWIITQKNAA